MRRFPSQRKSTFKTSRNPFLPNYYEGFRSVIGIQVYDKYDRLIGMVSDIYCDRFTLQILYLEVLPFDDSVAENFLYPFDQVNIIDESNAFLQIDYDSLKRFDDFRKSHIFLQKKHELISYSESLGISYFKSLRRFENSA